MEPDRWRRITEIFEAVVELPAEERSAYLDAACAGEAQLRPQVERLLAADARAEGFLDHPPGADSQTLARALSGDAVDTTMPAAGGGEAPEVRGRRIGKYEVLERIGEGGFGEVFKGRDPQLKRLVAIKVCSADDPDLRRRFYREAEIAAQLRHPNVTIVHDFGLEGEVPYLVQEYLEGEDLARQIAERRPTDLGTRIDVLVQIAQGLEHAHGRGVVHRDLKPSNVRVLPDGGVKIMDFGIAKLTTSSTPLTQTGATMGTIAYMAPEQLRGEEVDARADVFSFGVVAYELLTYERPFAADSTPAMLYRILEKNPLPLSDRWPQCPPALTALVRRCLGKDARNRYRDFTEVLAQLRPLAAALPAELGAAPPAAVGVGEQTPRRRRWPLAAALVVVLGLLAVVLGLLAAGAALLRRPPAPPAPVEVTGRLVIDALPWAEVRSVTDAEGREQEPVARYTPLALALPPGEYVVSLAHPRYPQLRRCRVEVVAGDTVRCREELAPVDPVDFFAASGWSP